MPCSTINQQNNVFDIVDNILVVGYDADGRGHHRTVRQLMQMCHQENLKHNKINVISDVQRFFREMISREGVQPNPKKLHTIGDAN